MEHTLSPSISIVEHLLEPLPEAFPFIRDRGSRNEAARVAEEAKNHFETGRCSDSDGFSARHSSREYSYYEQCRGFQKWT